MKKVLLLLLLMVGMVSTASAGASWIGNSYINVNGSWYTASGGSGDWTSGAFNDHDFGIVTSLTIGGQMQIYDSSSTSWTGNGDWMHYTIDKDYDAWVDLNMSKSGTTGNNMIFQTGGGSFATVTIDISGLSAGEHTISVYFGGVDGNYDSNGSNNYVAKFTVLPGDQTVSGGTNGIATYSFDYPLDFSSTTNITAYTVSSLSKTSATLTAMNQTVPANTGLIIMGTSESITPVATGTSVGTNYLHATGTSGTTVDADEAYILSAGKFHPANAGTIPANKAYLLASDIPATSTPGESRSLNLVYDETTGIDAAQISNDLLCGDYYNLAGQRVAKPSKGLYIVNGKKVIIK